MSRLTEIPPVGAILALEQDQIDPGLFEVLGHAKRGPGVDWLKVILVAPHLGPEEWVPMSYFARVATDSDHRSYCTRQYVASIEKQIAESKNPTEIFALKLSLAAEFIGSLAVHSNGATKVRAASILEIFQR